MAYCVKCGTELSAEAAFCPKCGNRGNDVEETLATSDSEETAPEGKALLVLSTNKKAGVFKSIPCYLVLFEDRVVFAHFNKDKQKAENKALQERIKSEGKGFFKGTAEMLHYWANYGNKYYEMNVADIMNEDSNNFELRHFQISKFVFKAAHSAKEDTSEQPGSIEIQAEGNKLKFTHKCMDYDKSVKKALEKLCKSKLKYTGSGSGFIIKIGGSKKKR